MDSCWNTAQNLTEDGAGMDFRWSSVVDRTGVVDFELFPVLSEMDFVLEPLPRCSEGWCPVLSTEA